MTRIIVATPTEDTLGLLRDMYASSPNDNMVYVPILFLSSPDETFSDQSPVLEDSMSFQISVRPIVHRNVHNTATKRTEMVMGVVLLGEDGEYTPSAEYRKQVLKVNGDPRFVPFFTVCYSPLVSRPSRHFLVSVANTLVKQTLTFDVQWTDEEAVMKTFNRNAVDELEPANPEAMHKYAKRTGT
jgi:hypothetical protein